MPDISKIRSVNGTTYDIKDAVARQAIGSYTKYLGVTTTALTDGSTTNPITIGGQSVTATAGCIAMYGNAEFIFNGTAWQAFGDLSALGDLAYKDSATGNFTPAGNITVNNPTVTLSTTTVNSITAVGTLPTCTFPTLTNTVEDETLIFTWTSGSFTQGTLPTKGTDQTVATGVQSATANGGSFTGTQGQVEVS